MPLDVIVVMDPIGSIKIAKDTTFAMLLEAQRRGHRLFQRHDQKPRKRGGCAGTPCGRTSSARLTPLQGVLGLLNRIHSTVSSPAHILCLSRENDRFQSCRPIHNWYA